MRVVIGRGREVTLIGESFLIAVNGNFSDLKLFDDEKNRCSLKIEINDDCVWFDDKNNILDESQIKNFGIEVKKIWNKSFLIMIEWKKIIYHQPQSELYQLDFKSDVVLIDARVGEKEALESARFAQATIVTVYHVDGGFDAVEFCRKVMLNHLGTPKYLKFSQYVVL